MDFKDLATETQLKKGKEGSQSNLEMLARNVAAKAYFAIGGKLDTVAWDDYKKSLIESTDHEKIDDVLRMVISGSKDQRLQLIEFLEEKRLDGAIFYGYHVSDSALVTCLVFDHKNNHMHFVDGNDGGYVHAAKQVKEQIKNS